MIVSDEEEGGFRQFCEGTESVTEGELVENVRQQHLEKSLNIKHK